MAGYYDFVKSDRESANSFIGSEAARALRMPKGGKETLAEHMQHCKAERPEDCPFQKAFYEADDLSSDTPETSKPILYDRLATALTQLYALGAEIARAAIDDDSSSAKTVSEAIEGGIDRIKEICEKAGCRVDMDDAKTKYIIVPPRKQD